MNVFYKFFIYTGMLVFMTNPFKAFGSDNIPLWEITAQNIINTTYVSLSGKIINEFGTPVANASISVGDNIQVTDYEGTFTFANTQRRNRLIKISASGYKNEFIPVNLYKSQDIKNIIIDPVILTKHNNDTTRFLFGGDTAFGRRYLDPGETIPKDQLPFDNPDALIQVSDPEPGTLKILEQIQPLFQDADWSSVNLETPVTNNPLTPHQAKDYVFFTLPQSLNALKWMGIDYAALGNNHVYDYLDKGIGDTLNNLDIASIPYSGAGLNNIDAFKPYSIELQGYNYSFLSMTSVTGNQHSVNYVADASKGGAADITDTLRAESAIKNEVSKGFIPIVQIHGGKEYTFEPTEYMQSNLKLAADAGAKLIIAHHPHIAQGVGIVNNVIAVHSLGNLIFDQDRHETMLGLLARVDMAGETIDELRLIPVYIEKYVPQMVSGRFADNFIRRIGEHSSTYGLLVYPYNNQARVALNPDDAVSKDRIVMSGITIPDSGTAIIDMRNWIKKGESLRSITTDFSELTGKIGRDIMLFGDFEDWDMDNEYLENKTWDISGASRFASVAQAYMGTASLASVRSFDNLDISVTPFRHRVRVMGDAVDTPNKDLSFLAYIKAQGAGPISVKARFYASAGDNYFGEQELVSLSGGSFDWKAFSSNINMPPDDPLIIDTEQNPRALRLFLYQEQPDTGTGTVWFDEIAIINWEQELNLTEEQVLSTPHAQDFIQISGPPGTYDFSFTFRSYEPFFKLLPGDIDHSRQVDLRDAILALQICAGISVSSEIIIWTDINSDNKIGIEEAVYALKLTAQ